MAYCAQCGTANPDDATFCVNCGVKLPDTTGTASSGSPTTSPPTTQPMTQPASGAYPQAPGTYPQAPGTYPQAPGAYPQAPGAYPQAVMYAPPRKDPAIAAILSFFITGLGQIYAGKVGKGIGLLVGVIVCIFLAFLLIPFFIAIGLWIYSIIDAYKTAERYNQFVAAYGRAPTSADMW